MKSVNTRATADRISGAFRRLGDTMHIVVDNELGLEESFYIVEEMLEDIESITNVVRQVKNELKADLEDEG